MDYRKELDEKELGMVSGGNIFEKEPGAGYNNADYSLCGISKRKCVVTRDEFYIGSKRIDNDTTKTILKRGVALWNDKYHEAADFIGFAREWKSILKNDYQIEWDGLLGEMNTGF